MATSFSTARNQLAAMQKAAQQAAAQRAAAQRAAQQAATQRAAQLAAAQQRTLQAAQLAAQQRSASRMAPTAPSNPQLGQFNPGPSGVFNPQLPMINAGQQAVDNRREFMTSPPTLPPEVQIRMLQQLREAEQGQSQMQQAQPLGGFGAQIGAAPQPQVEPFRPIEGLSGNLVGGFTLPSFGQQMPAQNMGFLQGMPPPGQQGMSQQALDVTQGSMAYPPSFSAIPQALMGQMGQQAMGLGMPQQGQMQAPMQSATQAAFQQAAQQAAQRAPSNQLNMYSGMPQQSTPMQSNMGGIGGQSNMFSAPQQSTPMQSSMGQGAQQSVGATSSNLFGGGPFASATQSGQQAQQPQQSNAPARTGGVF